MTHRWVNQSKGVPGQFSPKKEGKPLSKQLESSQWEGYRAVGDRKENWNIGSSGSVVGAGSSGVILQKPML